MNNPQATQQLPPGYAFLISLDLSKNKAAMIGLNLLGLALMVCFGWLFARIAIWLRPEVDLSSRLSSSQINSLGQLAGIIAVVIGILAAVVLLHEAVHGAFFWLFTRQRPHFGIRAAYAYASAPDWFIPRNQYLVVGIAPLVVLSLLGIALMAVVPESWLVPLLAFLVFNASGAVGDLVVIIWLLFQSSQVLAQDGGDAVTIYAPQPNQPVEAQSNNPYP